MLVVLCDRCLGFSVVTWLQLDLVYNYQPSDLSASLGFYTSEVIDWEDRLRYYL